MTKRCLIQDIDFGEIAIGSIVHKRTTLTNTGTESLDLSEASVDNDVFSIQDIDTKLMPKFPPSSTIYIGSGGVIQNANGEFYTTNQNLGIFGTTDGDGNPTINYTFPTIELTAPLSTAKYRTNQTITVNWNSTLLTHINIIIESDTGRKIYEAINASLGTYDVNLSSPDEGGFLANQS